MFHRLLLHKSHGWAGNDALQRRAARAIPLLYLATGIVFFLPFVVHDRVPLPLENTYYVTDSIWRHHAPVPLTGQRNIVLGDITGYYYPYMDAAVKRLRHGQIPLWNPEIFSGMPFMATDQPAVLYPLNILFSPVGPHWIWVCTAIARLWLMGWGLHLFMRRLGVRNVAALWSGIIDQFCGSSIAWLHFPIHNVLAWLPLALYATDRLLDRPRGRWFMLLAACLTFQFLGGHPETSLLFCLVWGSWTLVRGSWRRPASQFGLPLLAALAAVGLSLPQLLPTLALIKQSDTFNVRSYGAVVGSSWRNLKHWLLVINPYLYGTPLKNRYWGPPNMFHEWAVYVGLLALPFVVLGVVMGRPRRLRLYWACVAVLSLTWRFPLPAFAQVYHLPGMSYAAGLRFNFSWSLAAAVLAGLGVEALCAQRRRTIALFVSTTTACVAIVIVSVAATRGIGNWRPIFARSVSATTLAKIGAVYTLGNPSFAILLLTAVIGGLLAWLSILPRFRGSVPLLLLPILLVDLLGHGMPFNGSIAPAAIYPPTPITRRLQQTEHLFRIATLQKPILENNMSMTQDLQNALGYEDLLSAQYAAFAHQRIKINGRDQGKELEIMPPAQRFFDLANVEFVLSTTPVSTTPRWSLWQQDGKVLVYRNRDVLPRAFAVAQVHIATANDAVNAVFEPGFDPRHEALVEEPIPGLPTSKTPQAADRWDPRTTITRYTPEDVALTVDVDRPSLIVLSDSYDRGWQASVDGQPARLYRTNAVFRGVPVGSGHHTIVLRYVPQDVKWGLLGSLLTLLTCVGGCLWFRLRRAAPRLP